MIKVEDILYSSYFKQYIKVVKITSDVDWEFEIQGRILKAKTPLSYFENAKVESIQELVTKDVMNKIDESSGAVTGCGDK